MLRNNTNNFLSAELLQISALSNLNPVRFSVSSNQESSEEEKPVRRKGESTKSSSCSSDKEEAVTNTNNAKNSNSTIVVTNPMSVSVPNLTTESNSQIESTTTAGELAFWKLYEFTRNLGCWNLNEWSYFYLRWCRIDFFKTYILEFLKNLKEICLIIFNQENILILNIFHIFLYYLQLNYFYAG